MPSPPSLIYADGSFFKLMKSASFEVAARMFNQLVKDDLAVNETDFFLNDSELFANSVRVFNVGTTDLKTLL